MDSKRSQIQQHIASMAYQKTGFSHPPISREVVNNSQEIYKGTRPDQKNPNISGHGNERNGAN